MKGVEGTEGGSVTLSPIPQQNLKVGDSARRPTLSSALLVI